MAINKSEQKFQPILLNSVKSNSGACIITLITTIIYGFRNKLERLSLNTRLGWKGLPGTIISFMIQALGIFNLNKFQTPVWKFDFGLVDFELNAKPLTFNIAFTYARVY